MSRRTGFSSSELVELAKSLPDVLLKESDKWTNITFRGKGFAWADHRENRAMIKARHDERDALLATAPEVYEAGRSTSRRAARSSAPGTATTPPTGCR